MTITHLVISILLLLMQGHYWFDSVSNFILVYAYSTMTLRENILQLNGSTMHPWWVWHHYLCICLAGTLLLWPITPVYTMVRKQLLLFMVYIAAVQVNSTHDSYFLIQYVTDHPYKSCDLHSVLPILLHWIC